MTRISVLAAVLALASVAHAGWWDDAGAAKSASLADLRRDPGLWRDIVVSLDVRFDGLLEPGDPCSTRFVAAQWRAVAARPADDSAAKKAFTTCFVRRGSEAERRLLLAAKDARVALRAAVRDSVRGEPWIEVFDATGDADPLSPEETAVVARADEFLARDNAAAAEPLYRGVLAARALPVAVRAELWRKVGAACWSQRRHDDARAAYESALAADPNDAEAAKRLDAAKAVIAEDISPTSVAAAPVPTVRLLPPESVADAPSAPAPAAPVAAVPRRAPESVAAAPAADEPPAAPKPRLAGPK